MHVFLTLLTTKNCQSNFNFQTRVSLLKIEGYNKILIAAWCLRWINLSGQYLSPGYWDDLLTFLVVALSVNICETILSWQKGKSFTYSTRSSNDCALYYFNVLAVPRYIIRSHTTTVSVFQNLSKCLAVPHSDL